MGNETLIAWTDKTWNPWRGCDKVSPGCAHCYMFTQQERYGFNPAVVTRTRTWGDPRKWQQEAVEQTRRFRVFTASWSDFFHPDADPWRHEAWLLMKQCSRLDFQVLTKRPERIASCLPRDWRGGYPNVWLGVSVENEQFLPRVDTLRGIPAAVRFISAEPLLAPLPNLDLTDMHWLIVGGESGNGFRPMDHAWARDLYEKARAAGVAYFFKQSAALFTERGIALDGVGVVRTYPR
jgi:protein gp37